MFDSSFTERPTDFDELQFGKASVFNAIHIQDTLPLMLRNQIPDGGFWEYHNLRTGTENLVCPVRAEITRKYSGTFPRRRLKSMTAKFETSPVSYTAHALQRFYERTGYRQLTHSDFFIEQTPWFGELMTVENYFTENGVTIERSDFMVPFREGAFLGHVYLREDFEQNKYKVDFKGMELIPKVGRPCSQASFAALTYIRESQMFPAQRNIFEALQEENFEKAKLLTENSVPFHFKGVDAEWIALRNTINGKFSKN